MKLDSQALCRAFEERAVAQDNESIGDAVFAHVDKVAVVETTGWAPELLVRVSARIQANDTVEKRKGPVVNGSVERAAFTLPGRRIFVSRSLCEGLRSARADAEMLGDSLGSQRTLEFNKSVETGPAGRVAR